MAFTIMRYNHQDFGIEPHSMGDVLQCCHAHLHDNYLKEYTGIVNKQKLDKYILKTVLHFKTVILTLGYKEAINSENYRV